MTIFEMELGSKLVINCNNILPSSSKKTKQKKVTKEESSDDDAIEFIRRVKSNKIVQDKISKKKSETLNQDDVQLVQWRENFSSQKQGKSESSRASLAQSLYIKRKFTKQEDNAIISYIIRNNAYDRVLGMKMYEEMSAENV